MLLRTLVVTVALVVWWVSVSSFTPVTLSENTKTKLLLDTQEDSDTLTIWSVLSGGESIADYKPQCPQLHQVGCMSFLIFVFSFL